MLKFWIIGACIGSALTNQFPWIWASLPGLALLANRDQHRELIFRSLLAPSRSAQRLASLTLTIAIVLAATHHVYRSHSSILNERKPSKNPCQERAAPQLKAFPIPRPASSWSVALEKGNMLDTSICDLRSQLREIVHQQFPKQGSLIMSLLLGETQFKGEDQTNTFKRLGILHLLVVSGFHVTLVAEVLAHLLRLLTLPLSALGIIQGRRALQLLGIQTTLLIITVWGYCMVVGFSAATQRSFFLFILSILTRGGFLQSTYAQRSWLSLSLQALIFPLEFASKGNVLSWAAYLIVSAPRVREGMLRQGFIVPMLSQLTISLTVFALFGEISWAGLLANFLLGPIFSALISHSLYLVFFGSLLSWHSPLPDLCIDNLLQVLSHLSTLTLIYPWLYLQSSPLPSWQTWILLQVTALYLFYLHKPQSLQA